MTTQCFSAMLLQLLCKHQGYSPGIRSCLWSEINNNKSSITFSSKTRITIRNSTKQILDIQKEGGLGKYLELLEHFGRRKKDLFISVVDRIKQRAASWSTCHLSIVWKMTMVKSVITAVPTYYMSCFLIPVGLCKRIQSALTRFWWDGNDEKKKLCYVSWTDLSKPKNWRKIEINIYPNLQSSSPRGDCMAPDYCSELSPGTNLVG